ncbi:MAG: NAD-dependent succinate-semialdehyde dehydrogenase [Hyphomicrobiales bacterium]
MQVQKQIRDENLDQLQDRSLFREFSYINGEWCADEAANCIDVFNPATNAWVGSVPNLTAGESGRAVSAANNAFKEWSQKLPQDRAAILRKWHDLLLENKTDLAIIMTSEQGKPLAESKGEIDYAAAFLEFYAEEAKRPNIEGITSHLDNAEVEVWREPMGVVGLITPWNFPSAMITRKAAAALAAGCTVVAHPSIETPFSALALAELAERAGVPKGVFNIITGKAENVVKPWMETPTVRAISFTGSTKIGKLLYQQSANTVKQMVLELGGHASFIVFDDADIDRAVECAVSAKFATSGQDCLAANRILVQKQVYNEFCEKFAKSVSQLTIGNGMTEPDIGPLMNKSAVLKQCEHVEDALEKGAELLLGGKPSELGDLFFEPTILKNVSHDAKMFSQETFGPVAGITCFETDDEVLELANANEYALVAYVHTQLPKRIYHFTRNLQFGMVAVNRTKVTGAPIPFGGMKQSGMGREGARLGMEAFMEVKYVCRDF